MSNTYSISVETGGYRQLDLFAERCGEGNAVVTVADGNGVAIAAHTMPIAERRHHFSIAVPQKSTVTVAASGLVVRFGYLSECDDLLDNGVRYVNMNQATPIGLHSPRWNRSTTVSGVRARISNRSHVG